MNSGDLASKTKPKVSVITVVRNDKYLIERTIKSVSNQDYDNIEYIIIDGNSNDGTKEVIERNSDKVTLFLSEEDDGIYHAMNKGAMISSGDLLAYLNSGDYYVDQQVISDVVIHWLHNGTPDVVYGHSNIESKTGSISRVIADSSIEQLWKGPVFRHGSMFVRRRIQLENPFDVDDSFRISADFKLIFHLYSEKATFSFIDRSIITFNDGGVSSNHLRCLKDNWKIVRCYTKNPKYWLWYSQQLLKAILRIIFYATLRPFLGIFYQFLTQYLTNNIIAYIPFYCVRHFYYRRICGIKIGKYASIHLRTFITGTKISIGENSVIGRSCYLDGRCSLTIGSNVSISPHVHIITASHDLNSAYFSNIWKPVEIGDQAWIGSRATIMPGVKIGVGAVVGVGSVVTKNVDPYDVVAGNPAKRIKTRNKLLNYSTKWMPYFD